MTHQPRLCAGMLAVLTAMIPLHARAGTAALPPLPPGWTFMGAGAATASGREALAPTPFPSWPATLGDSAEEADEASDERSADAMPGDTATGTDLGTGAISGKGSGGITHATSGEDVGRSGARAARSVSEGSGDAADLEGPPAPLAPPERMSPAAPRVESGAPDDAPITMRFRDASLTDVLDAFARFTGINIVASERARGSVTLFLNEVPWRAAFDTLLDAKGLAMTRRGNVIWVAPVAELAARERQRFESHARAANLEPLLSRTFALRYPRAEEVQRLLTGSGSQRVLSKRGAAMADARTNLLFVTDLAARLDEVARLIEAIDKPTRQVLIEARIVEGARGFSRDLGARLSVRAAAADGSQWGAAGLAGGGNGRVYDLAAQALGGFDAATAGLTLFAARATRLVTAELSALEAQGRGQIVSNPRIVTADRAKATVEQGTELPYQAKVRHGVSGVQFRRATLRLDVEPRITPNGRVILELDIAKDSVGLPTAAGPAIDTKRIRTRVEVEDGGTVSIGGIYERIRRDDVTRVPLLGKIPVLGAFFRHRAQREQASELVVFITPRVVDVD